jgi:hypothetical protein
MSLPSKDALFQDLLVRVAALEGLSGGALADIATSGSASDLDSGTVPAARMPALTGDVTTTVGAVATTIGANKVLDTMLRDSVGLSALGRSASTTGDPADIVAASDGDVLRRSGTTLGFGAIPETSVTNLTVDLTIRPSRGVVIAMSLCAYQR